MSVHSNLIANSTPSSSFGINNDMSPNQSMVSVPNRSEDITSVSNQSMANASVSNQPTVSASVRNEDVERNTENTASSSEQNARKRKRARETSPDWKESFFKSVRNLEEVRHAAEIQKTRLESYNLLLRNLSMEKELGKHIFVSI